MTVCGAAAAVTGILSPAPQGARERRSAPRLFAKANTPERTFLLPRPPDDSHPKRRRRRGGGKEIFAPPVSRRLCEPAFPAPFTRRAPLMRDADQMRDARRRSV